MVVRRRLQRILLPLVLYAISAGIVGYFVREAHSGARGTEARQQYEALASALNREFDDVHAERSDWERRIALLRSDQIDRDLLEEQARIMLGRVHPNDLVIMTGQGNFGG